MWLATRLPQPHGNPTAAGQLASCDTDAIRRLFPKRNYHTRQQFYDCQLCIPMLQKPCSLLHKRAFLLHTIDGKCGLSLA